MDHTRQDDAAFLQNAGFSPFDTQGVALGWYAGGPLALFGDNPSPLTMSSKMKTTDTKEEATPVQGFTLRWYAFAPLGHLFAPTGWLHTSPGHRPGITTPIHSRVLKGRRIQRENAFHLP